MPEKLHILFYDYVPDLVERRAPHRDGHLALIHRWHEEGRLVMAGPLGDPPHSGAFVLRIGDASAADEFVAQDPYAEAGLVKSWRVEPWNVVT
ncbi:MAG: uncharacterized protein QOC78_2373 [Solirubrobacteraceae bacterium]|jgi:uncharacterized protein YciI|nr:uncharacterized protein [Solirubrobacteraceae bacterium]